MIFLVVYGLCIWFVVPRASRKLNTRILHMNISKLYKSMFFILIAIILPILIMLVPFLASVAIGQGVATNNPELGISTRDIVGETFPRFLSFSLMGVIVSTISLLNLLYNYYRFGLNKEPI